MSAAAKKKIYNPQNNGGKKQNADKAYPWSVLAVGIFMLLLLITDCWSFKNSPHLYFVYFAFGTCLIFIGTFLFKANRQLMFDRIPKISLFLTAQCLLYFIALFYATYPKFEIQKFFLNIGALLVFVTAYVSFRRSDNNIKSFARLFSIIIAAASLISIELATSGIFRYIIQPLAFILHAQIPGSYGAFETNTRITSILGNANVFAPIAVFGMLVSIWCFGKPGERSRRAFIYLSLAIACGTAFVLCFSLGTILSYIVMFVVYIIVSGKGNRSGQLLVHLFALIMSLIAASLVFALRDKSLLPLLTVLVISAGSALAYTRMKPVKLPDLGAVAKKSIFAGIIAVCVVFIVCASLLQGSYNLDPAESFRRAVAVKPGTYSFTAQFDNAPADATITAEISSMSYAEAALKEKTILTTVKLKSGEAADFNVPEHSAAVFVSITADSGLRVHEAVINGDGVSKQLPLKYSILPEFIVNRLQGLWVNDNAIQRFIFFRDGILLGLKSPVFGLGGGAFEGGEFKVADYYYQSTHSHNEYIERFTEGGIIGAALFIGFTVWVFRALFKARHNEKAKSYLPLLTGCMVMIFVHALVEVDFVFGSYRVASALLFALVAAVCEDDLRLGRKLKAGFISAFTVLVASITLLSIGQAVTSKLLESQKTLETLRNAMVLDPLDRYDYKLAYILSTKSSEKQQTIETQEKYLDSMKNSVVGYEARAQFFFEKAQPDYQRGITAAEAYIHEYRVGPDSWDTIFALYNKVLDTQNNNETLSTISGSIQSLSGYLQELNKTLPKKVEPELAVFTYLRSESIKAGQSGTLVDSRIACDLNQDGKPDLVDGKTSDTISWKLKAPLPGAYVIKIYQQESALTEVTLNGNPCGVQYTPEEGCYVTYVSAPAEPISELSINTTNSDNVYFKIEIAR